MSTSWYWVACEKKAWHACTMHVYQMQKNMARQVLVSYRTLLCTSDTVPYVPCTALMRNSQTSPLGTRAHVTIKQVACKFFSVGGLAPAALVPRDRLTVISVLHFAFFFLLQRLLPHMLIVVSVFLLFSPSLHLVFCSLLSLISASFAFICLYFCCFSSWQASPHEPCQRPGTPLLIVVSFYWFTQADLLISFSL